jgi:tetratricopeptide (TPR) repeat protein
MMLTNTPIPHIQTHIQSRNNMKSYPIILGTREITCEKQLQRAISYHFRGWHHYRRHDLDASLCDWRKSLRIRHSLLGASHPSTRESIDLIGTILKRKGLAASASKRYLRRLKISIEHETNGDRLGKLADYGPALKEYQKSLDVEEETIGRDHPVVAALYRKMAVTLKGLGQLERSTLVYCDALA